METRNLGTLYDFDALDWTAVTATLDTGVTQAPDSGGPDRHTCWLTTIDPDGRPHVAAERSEGHPSAARAAVHPAVGALWTDGTFWFKTGPATRKGRNLARDPRCALAVAVHEYDLVVEGTSERVTDPATVARIAGMWADEGWPARPDASGQAITAEFSAASAGPPPWHVHRMTPVSATAMMTVMPGGATRWIF